MICKRCGKDKAPDEFEISVTRRVELVPKIYRKRTCKICLVELRLEAKQSNPCLTAFKQRRQSHAERLGIKATELRKMGWDEVQRSREMEAQFAHGFCPSCVDDDGTVHFFRDMTNGLSELTIDIIDPKQLPVWPGNVQWLCLTCNRRKQRRSGMEDGLERVMVRQWIADEPPDAHGQQALF